MSPEVEGLPIEITFARDLRAHRGNLLSGKSAPGSEVHAASFIRKRKIVLDAELKKQPSELARILIHELFHFVWLRLGNVRRRSFEDLLTKEMRGSVRGELGWSAERLKVKLNSEDRTARSRRWRTYACESFCDTAAWLLARVENHDEYTLVEAGCRGRRAWFVRTGLLCRITV